MTIVHRTGDLFTTDAPALAHGVNVQGAMSGGIAAQFAKRWPGILFPYRIACGTGGLKPGDIQVYDQPNGPLIYNLATQRLPGPDARLHWIESALATMRTDMRTRHLDRVAMPRIGCGIGGLNWHDVEPLIALAATDITIEVWTLNEDPT